MDLNEASESIQAKLFAELFGDIDAQINRLNKLKSEIPAAISKDINDAIDQAKESIQNLAGLVETVSPGVEKSIAVHTDKLTAQVGLITKATEAMNAKADAVIEKKTATLDTIVKNKVEEVIGQSLSNKIYNELDGLKKALVKSEEKVKNIAAAADRASHGNLYWWLGSLCMSGLIGGLLAAMIFMMALGNGRIKVDIDPHTVATDIASQFKTSK